MDIKKQIIEKYALSEGGTANTAYAERRTATIIFVNGEFDRCDYEVNKHNNYIFDDWMFLLKVAQKIKELKEEEGDK